MAMQVYHFIKTILQTPTEHVDKPKAGLRFITIKLDGINAKVKSNIQNEKVQPSEFNPTTEVDSNALFVSELEALIKQRFGKFLSITLSESSSGNMKVLFSCGDKNVIAQIYQFTKEILHVPIEQIEKLKVGFSFFMINLNGFNAQVKANIQNEKTNPSVFKCEIEENANTLLLKDIQYVIKHRFNNAVSLTLSETNTGKINVLFNSITRDDDKLTEIYQYITNTLKVPMEQVEKPKLGQFFFATNILGFDANIAKLLRSFCEDPAFIRETEDALDPLPSLTETVVDQLLDINKAQRQVRDSVIRDTLCPASIATQGLFGRTVTMPDALLPSDDVVATIFKYKG